MQVVWRTAILQAARFYDTLMTELLLVQYTFVMNNRSMMVLQREVGLKFFVKLKSYISQLHSFKTEGSVNITNVSFRNLRFLISSSCYKQTYEGLFFKKSDFLYAQSTERISNLTRWIFLFFFFFLSMIHTLLVAGTNSIFVLLCFL